MVECQIFKRDFLKTMIFHICHYVITTTNYLFNFIKFHQFRLWHVKKLQLSFKFCFKMPKRSLHFSSIFGPLHTDSKVLFTNFVVKNTNVTNSWPY